MPPRPSAPSAKAVAPLSQVTPVGRSGVVLTAAAQNWWWALVAAPDSSLFCGSAADVSGQRRLVMSNSNWRQAHSQEMLVGHHTMTVLVASKNRVTVHAVTTAFQRLFPDTSLHFRSVGVQSEASEQPFSDEECVRGTRNRVKNAGHMAEEADFVVAIEGGVEWCSFTEEPQLLCFAWAVVLSKDLEGKARTVAFMLPPPLAEFIAVEGGKEMLDVDDKHFKRESTKSSTGTAGLLAGNDITTQAYYEHAMTMALIPFINPELFSSPSVPVIPSGSGTKFPEPA